MKTTLHPLTFPALFCLATFTPPSSAEAALFTFTMPDLFSVPEPDVNFGLDGSLSGTLYFELIVDDSVPNRVFPATDLTLTFAFGPP